MLKIQNRVIIGKHNNYITLKGGSVTLLAWPGNEAITLHKHILYMYTCALKGLIRGNWEANALLETGDSL